MTETDGALAGFVGKVTNSHDSIKTAIRTGVNLGEKILLAIFRISSQRIAAKVGNLNHAGEFAVNKQRGLDYPLYLNPQGATLVKGAHHLSVFTSDGLIVVMHKEAESPLATWFVNILEVALEAGNELFKRLLT